MSVGPSGFSHAPISKALLLVCGGSTLISHIMHNKNLLLLKAFPELFQRGQLWRLITGQIVFSTGPEAVSDHSCFHPLIVSGAGFGGVVHISHV